MPARGQVKLKSRLERFLMAANYFSSGLDVYIGGRMAVSGLTTD
jgi:hypothetical protein